MICVAIVLLALIAKWAIWSWQHGKLEYARWEQDFKKTKEEGESARKQTADQNSRENQLQDKKRERQNKLEDEERKKKADLLEKKLNFLHKCCCSPQEKEIIKEGVEKYVNAIDNELAKIETSLNSKEQAQP